MVHKGRTIAFSIVHILQLYKGRTIAFSIVHMLQLKNNKNHNFFVKLQYTFFIALTECMTKTLHTFKGTVSRDFCRLYFLLNEFDVGPI